MLPRFNLLLTVAYDGAPFLGWQETKEGPSIAGELRKALKILTKEDVALNGASRTDAGVHALGQLVNVHTRFTPPPPLLLKSLNGLLPHEIRVTAIEEVNDDFHATLHNAGKEYRYRLSYGPVQFPHMRFREWHIPGKLDLALMEKAALFLTGCHDFKAFCNAKKNEPYDSTIRQLHQFSLDELGDHTLEITMKGNRFLYKMARNLVGTLVYVGKGRIHPNALAEIMQRGERSRLGPTAPAHGLTLFRVLRKCID